MAVKDAYTNTHPHTWKAQPFFSKQKNVYMLQLKINLSQGRNILETLDSASNESNKRCSYQGPFFSKRMHPSGHLLIFLGESLSNKITGSR